MLQDVHLFSGTIAGNVRLGHREITDEAVRRAVDAVHAGPFIDRLPGGLDAPVAERGSTLSVGQKQLLSFARALAADPPVLILDEATSSVDTETELLIRDALRVLMAGRTTLAIAHRLSTIQDMDSILVLHKGELREQGTHQQLLAQRGIYRRLFELQFASGREDSRAGAGASWPLSAGASAGSGRAERHLLRSRRRRAASSAAPEPARQARPSPRSVRRATRRARRATSRRRNSRSIEARRAGARIPSEPQHGHLDAPPAELQRLVAAPDVEIEHAGPAPSGRCP